MTAWLVATARRLLLLAGDMRETRLSRSGCWRALWRRAMRAGGGA